jgi:hypothetical protein
VKLDECGMTPECSRVSYTLFSELQWNLISFGRDAGILNDVGIPL